MRVINMAGQKIGRLQVLERNGKDRFGQIVWKCRCECGNITNVPGGHLRTGHTTSCGCLAKEVNSKVHTTHGKRNTRLYRIWSNMLQRCKNPNVKEYKWYGAKGVSVCDEWKNDFQSFYDWAIANGYRDDLSIDRINSNGNYNPSNCRWISISEQQSNRSNNRFLTHNGETHNIKEWASVLGIDYFRLYSLLEKNNFDIGAVMECIDS